VFFIKLDIIYILLLRKNFSQNYTNETTKLEIRKKQVEALKSAAGFSDELLEYGLT